MTAIPAPRRIIVVGSANQDLIIRVTALPAAGETILGQSLLRRSGGKGANQAVAAARLGAAVALVAAIGDDAEGRELLRALQDEDVDTAAVDVITGAETGAAFVTVDASGENSITVVPGANLALTPRSAEHSVQRLARGTAAPILLVQAELRVDTVAAALTAGAHVGARCILNLAPYLPLSPELLAVSDPLIVNESEASSLLGQPVNATNAATAALEVLRHVRSVVITLGPRGAYWADPTGQGHVAVKESTRVVDTTGAGDALVGALAATLAHGETLQTAVELGVAAGTFSVASPGAQTSYPRRADLGLTDSGGISAKPAAEWA